MKRDLVTKIETQNGKSEFQLRFFMNEGAGLLTTRDGEDYLIANSIDLWYHLTQKTYPKKKVCSCKSDFFALTFCDESQDGESNNIYLMAICASCQKKRKITSVSVKDASPDKLLSRCQQPRIRYKVSQLTSYWSLRDVETFLKFMANGLKMSIYCWYINHSDNKRYFERVEIFQARNIITRHTFLNFYFSEEELDTANFMRICSSEESSRIPDQEPWRCAEVISLSAPMYIYGYGMVYFIEYCQKYINQGILQSKSHKFERKTVLLRAWLKDTFVSNRGSNCYDGKEASERFDV